MADSFSAERPSPNDAPDLLLDGHRLTLAETVAVARRPRRPRVALAPEAVDQMDVTTKVKRELIAAGLPIYGVTAGFGDSNTRQVSEDKSAALQENLLRFLGCGTGPDAEPDVTRATLVVRANCLARGYSAIRPEVVGLLLDCLNHDILPMIPERGSVGASGDLVPLSYVARMLTGEGEVRHAERIRPAADALADAGLTPIALEAKEGLALVNGTSFMSGFAVLAAHDATELAFVAELCTALASQVLNGNPAHFDDFLFRQKPHEGVLTSARTVRELLSGDEPDAGAPGADETWNGDGYRQLDRPIQDRYSVRCSPHVVGALRDTLEWAERMLEIEVNSSNDNPLFHPDGTVLNGGNFYGGHVGQTMDSLKIAVASVGDLLDRQLELVVDEKFNNGLTPNLIPRFEGDSWDAGLHHGFKGMQLSASSLVAEALRWTTPATSFSRSTEAHNQDKVSMGTIAARDARSVVGLVQEVAAIHLLALCQAADLRGLECLSPATSAAHTEIRKLSPFLDGDRPLHDDIRKVTEAVRSGELRTAVAGTIG
ncbi:aromatic amino acid lyase [Actinomadura darangshiensis]|uniref:Aromatic amino acid lyase n=1 Tax=Actinomadura darangshiensis TaxID=705336 RepID=A0A4R5BTX5_9ACTN|nr:aromatic amino acid ammonia-lyase [Actinomadura darangshiensis]TDD87652.1 aromatic amino acid lyase [Actinomadura darangshiensis]